eukprot:SAG25_NODE_3179_length_1185_cov_1.014733_2_plen_217_part_00
MSALLDTVIVDADSGEILTGDLVESVHEHVLADDLRRARQLMGGVTLERFWGSEFGFTASQPPPSPASRDSGWDSSSELGGSPMAVERSPSPLLQSSQSQKEEVNDDAQDAPESLAQKRVEVKINTKGGLPNQNTITTQLGVIVTEDDMRFHMPLIRQQRFEGFIDRVKSAIEAKLDEQELPVGFDHIGMSPRVQPRSRLGMLMTNSFAFAVQTTT